jgi:iron complex outermembrane receptor protein
MCARLTAAQYGNGGTTDRIPQGAAQQLSQLTGGNTNLKREQGETYTVGVNFRPSQMPGPGAHTYDCAGYFGYTCQTINPRWHHIFRTTWTTPLDGLSAAATWRYIGPVSEDNNSPDPTLHFSAWGAYDYYNARIPSYSYLDLEATWQPTKILTLRAGINNVFDKDPPLIDVDLVGGGAANTYPIYDMFGRQLFVALTARF